MLFAFPHTAEECRKGQVETLESDPCRVGIERPVFWMISPDLGQAPALRDIANGLAGEPIGVDSLLPGRVVQVAVQLMAPPGARAPVPRWDKVCM